MSNHNNMRDDRKQREEKINDFKHLNQTELRELLKEKTTKPQRKQMGFDLNAKLPILREQLMKIEAQRIVKASKQPREYDILRRELKGRVQGNQSLRDLRDFKKLNEIATDKRRKLTTQNLNDYRKLSDLQSVKAVDEFNQLMNRYMESPYQSKFDFKPYLRNLATGNQPMVLQVNFKNGDEHYFPIRYDSINDMDQLFNRRVSVEVDDSYGYNPNLQTVEFENVESFVVVPYHAPANAPQLQDFAQRKDEDVRLRRKHNSFANFLIDKKVIQINLEKYQIYTMGLPKKNEEESCLIHTLRMSGIDEEKVDVVMRTLYMGKTQLTTNLKDLEKVAEVIQRRIRVVSLFPVKKETDEDAVNSDIEDSGVNEEEEKDLELSVLSKPIFRQRNVYFKKRYSSYFGDSEHKELIINQFQNHYFMNEETKYNAFYIKNYHRIQKYIFSQLSTGKLTGDEKRKLCEVQQFEFNRVKHGKYYADKSKKTLKLDSLELVKAMYERDMFLPYEVNEMMGVKPSNNYKHTPSLVNLFMEQEEYEMENTGTGKPPRFVIFADTETDTGIRNIEETKSNGSKPHKAISFAFSVYSTDFNEFLDVDGELSGLVYGENMGYKINDSLFTQINNGWKKLESKYGVDSEDLRSSNEIVMYIHNSKYDLRVLSGLLYTIKSTEKDGNIYSQTILVRNPKYEVKEDKTTTKTTKEDIEKRVIIRLQNYKSDLTDNEKDQLDEEKFKRNALKDIKAQLKREQAEKKQNQLGKDMIPMSERKSYEIKVVDSWKILRVKLSDFPEVLGLDPKLKKQEAINYNYHNASNMRADHRESVEVYRRGIKAKDRPNFKGILESNKELFKYDEKTEMFSPLHYYNHYLKYDVLVLKHGILKLRNEMKQFCEKCEVPVIDLFNVLTISSLAHKFATIAGCYDGLFHIKGSGREFIQKGVRGGKVYVVPREKCFKHISKIANFDAVSLYPSAMKRFCSEIGFPKGHANEAPTNWTYEDYCNKDVVSYYEVEIEITRVNKSRTIPCFTYKDEQGRISYLNDLPEVDGVKLTSVNQVVDKITLEDLIKYHDIEFKIIKGCYWEVKNGFNNKLAEVVEKLYQWRKSVKKTNKPLSELIKLILNSIYGRTVLKRAETTVLYRGKNTEGSFVKENFGGLKKMIRINNEKGKHIQTKFEIDKCDDSYSLNMVGCMILSMSKRIMNEVFDVMEDNNMRVIYSDTDSIHMFQKDVSKLQVEYTKKYDRLLIDEKNEPLGSFHEDFSMNIPKVDETGKIKVNSYGSAEVEKLSSVISICNITLMPKVYLDVLRGYSTLKKEHYYEAHIVCKGITKEGLKCYIESKMNETKNKTQKYQTVFSEFSNILKTIKEEAEHALILESNNKELQDEVKITTNEELLVITDKNPRYNEFLFIETTVRMFSEFADVYNAKPDTPEYKEFKEVSILMNPSIDKPAFEYVNASVEENPLYKEGSTTEQFYYTPQHVIIKSEFRRSIKVMNRYSKKNSVVKDEYSDDVDAVQNDDNM